MSEKTEPAVAAQGWRLEGGTIGPILNRYDGTRPVLFGRKYYVAIREIVKAHNSALAATEEKAAALRDACKEMLNQYSEENDTGWRKRMHDNARAALAQGSKE